MSNDAAIIAGQIQDLASSVENVAEAVRAKPAPQVTVNVPEQAPAPVTVNVAVPEQPAPQVVVNVPGAAAPVVTVAPPVVQIDSRVSVPPVVPNAYEVEITERDDQGYIRRFTINPR